MATKPGLLPEQNLALPVCVGTKRTLALGIDGDIGDPEVAQLAFERSRYAFYGERLASALDEQMMQEVSDAIDELSADASEQPVALEALQRIAAAAVHVPEFWPMFDARVAGVTGNMRFEAIAAGMRPLRAVTKGLYSVLPPQDAPERFELSRSDDASSVEIAAHALPYPGATAKGYGRGGPFYDSLL